MSKGCYWRLQNMDWVCNVLFVIFASFTICWGWVVLCKWKVWDVLVWLGGSQVRAESFLSECVTLLHGHRYHSLSSDFDELTQKKTNTNTNTKQRQRQCYTGTRILLFLLWLWWIDKGRDKHRHRRNVTSHHSFSLLWQLQLSSLGNFHH